MTNPQEFISNVLADKKRWGKLYTNQDVPVNELLEALAQLAGEQDVLELVPKAALTKANRQITAAKAREGRLRKEVESLKQQLGSFGGLSDT